MIDRKRRGAAVAAFAVLLAALLTTPARASHSISLTANPTYGVWGTTFSLRGFTGSSTQVKLQRRFVGQSSWSDVTGQPKTSNSGGFYVFYDEPFASADYRSIVVSDGATSGTARVRVRPGVHIAVGSSGERALFTGKVLPAHVGTRVVLQMFDGINKRWNNVLSTRLNSSSAYRMAFKGTDSGRRLFRVTWPTQDLNHMWNVSAEVFVTWIASQPAA